MKFFNDRVKKKKYVTYSLITKAKQNLLTKH